MNSLLRDLRYAARALGRDRWFTSITVAILALGIGASTAMFSAVDALLLKPLPFPDTDRLVFGLALREGVDPYWTSALEYLAYRESARSLTLSGLAAARSLHWIGSGEPERLQGAAVSSDYLRALAISPLLGRVFTPDEDRPGGGRVALLGYGLWKRRFGHDRECLGRSILLDAGTYTVVGVMPPGFDEPYGAELWVPLQTNLAALPLTERNTHLYEMAARLKPGVRRQEAIAELQRIALRLEREYPQIRRGWTYTLVTPRQQFLRDLRGRTRLSIIALALAVGLVLLACCANVASLLLARSVTRRTEMAVRLSLGAGRARLLRQLLTESLVLAFAGGAAGLMLAFVIAPLIARLNPIDAYAMGGVLTDFRIDGLALGFALAATIGSALAFGLAPALRLTRDVAADLRAGGRTIAGNSRPLSAIVAVEVAVAVTLLASAGVMTRSFRTLSRIDLGFRPGNVLAMTLPLSPRRYPGPGPRIAFVDDLLERVRSVAGVSSAGMASNLPLDTYSLDAAFEVEGRPRDNPASLPMAAYRLTTPGYLEAIGIRLNRGRLIDGRDSATSLPVAVVSEELVRQAWPGEDPLGKRLRRVLPGTPTPWLTVVGVLKDVREDRFNFRIERPVWYVPYAQQAGTLSLEMPLQLAVRTPGHPATLAAALRSVIRSADPAQPISRIQTLSEHVGEVLNNERFSTSLMAALAGVGLALSALGLYGTTAFSVRQRVREIGVRAALGASPRQIVGLFVRRGALLSGMGVAAGLAAARGSTQILSRTLYGVSPSDPATFGSVLLLLAAIALVATYVPARRAARVDPMTALRNE